MPPGWGVGNTEGAGRVVQLRLPLRPSRGVKLVQILLPSLLSTCGASVTLKPPYRRALQVSLG